MRWTVLTGTLVLCCFCSNIGWALFSNQDAYTALIAAGVNCGLNPADYNNNAATFSIDQAFADDVAAAINSGSCNGLQSARRRTPSIQSMIDESRGRRQRTMDHDEGEVLPWVGTSFSWKNMIAQGTYVSTFVTQVTAINGNPTFLPVSTSPLNWTNDPNVFWGAEYTEQQMVWATGNCVENGAGTLGQIVSDNHGNAWNYATQEAGWNQATYHGDFYNGKVAIFTGMVNDIGSGQNNNWVGVTLALRCRGRQTDRFGAGLQCDIEFIKSDQTVCSGPVSITVTTTSRITDVVPFTTVPAVPANCVPGSTATVGDYNVARVPRCTSCTKVVTAPFIPATTC